jgi:hypothetical protein
MCAAAPRRAVADADDADGDDSMSPVMKRIAVLGLMALTLGACDYGLLTPDPADPGDTITVTNAPDGPTCFEPLVDPSSAHAAIDQSVPVGIFVLTSVADLIESGPDDITVVQSDDEGFFTAEVAAPGIPGQHIVFAICDYSDELPVDEVLEDAAVAEVVDETGVVVDDLIVTQQPLSIGLSDTSVEQGDEVIATFNRCKDENDFDLGELDVASAAETPTPAELAVDFPDLEVFLDDGTEPIAIVEGTERYPTGTVDVPITLTEVGDHEIKGVCAYQTFRFDLATLVEFFNEVGGELPPLEGVSAAAGGDIAYPFPEDGSEGAQYGQWDEAITDAAGTVTVLAVDDSAVPAPLQPTFTG